MTPEQFIGAEAWFNSTFFNEYLLPNDIHFQIGADFLSDEQSECRFRACRPLASGAFSQVEKNFCELLIPHFKRAVHLHSRLYTIEVEQALYASTFDRMQVGTVILDEAGKLLTTNQAATAIFTKRESMWLNNGTLHARQKNVAQELRAAITAALATSTDSVVIKALSIQRSAPHAPLKVLIKNIPPSQRVEGSHRPAVVIYIRDPERVVVPSVDTLRMLFHFTPAEAVFARMLAEGLSLDEAGQQLGISKNTSKSRLRSMFAKTGTTRQAALVRILLDAIVSL
jgi:DNA-binding CsgD family transcriptional regulator